MTGSSKVPGPYIVVSILKEPKASVRFVVGCQHIYIIHDYDLIY